MSAAKWHSNNVTADFLSPPAMMRIYYPTQRPPVLKEFILNAQRQKKQQQLFAVTFYYHRHLFYVTNEPLLPALMEVSVSR